MGAPQVTLELAVDRPGGLRLRPPQRDRARWRASTRITYGLLNLTHRDSHEHPDGRWCRASATRSRSSLNDIAHAFAAGNRIRVAVSTSYWPMVWPSPEPVTLTIFTGASRLELPVREPRAEDAKLRPFAASEGAEPLAKTYHRPSSGRRWIERDIGAGISTYCIRGGYGPFHHRAYRAGDGFRAARSPIASATTIPSRPRSRSSIRIAIGRGDWKTRSETRTVMRADKSHFHHRGEPRCL